MLTVAVEKLEGTTAIAGLLKLLRIGSIGNYTNFIRAESLQLDYQTEARKEEV